jgi:hypothetical protein
VSVYVFTGPTIPPEEARLELQATYLPPAAEGDVYRVSLKRPEAIGIIDGYFQSTPAVRHKEILWAMSRGIHVFGSASMGALRAAELAAFGVEGVGMIFELYRDGVLEDDDEVAVVHGSAETGFLTASEAMINMRQTLRTAAQSGIVSIEVRKRLEHIAKDLFYPDRTYAMLLRAAAERGLPRCQLDKLRQWLRHNRVDQKRQDAVAMLRLMRERLTQGLKPKTVSYRFESTAMWETARRESGELRFNSDAHSSVVVVESLLDELRLEGQQYRQHSLLALERFFAIRDANVLGMIVTDRSRNEAELAFRREHDLLDDAKLQHWMGENGLSHAEFRALITDEARVRWSHERNQFISLSYLPEQLRVSGEYPRLITRASAKRRLLDSIGLNNPCLADTNLTENQLIHWYFEEVLGRLVPHDPMNYAREVGFANSDTFRRALIREYVYRRFHDHNAFNGRPAFRSADHSGADQTWDRAAAALE